MQFLPMIKNKIKYLPILKKLAIIKLVRKVLLKWILIFYEFIYFGKEIYDNMDANICMCL